VYSDPDGGSGGVVVADEAKLKSDISHHLQQLASLTTVRALST